MQKSVALEELFLMEPFSWLLIGSHRSAFAHPTIGLYARNEVSKEIDFYTGHIRYYERLAELHLSIFESEKLEILDMNVNGHDFAITSYPLLHRDTGSKREFELQIVARHCFNIETSLEFNAKFHIQVPISYHLDDEVKSLFRSMEKLSSK